MAHGARHMELFTRLVCGLQSQSRKEASGPPSLNKWGAGVQRLALSGCKRPVTGQPIECESN